MNLNIRAAVLKMKSEGVRSRFGTNSHPGKSNMIIQYPLTLMSFPRSRSIFLWSRLEWPKCSLVLASRFPAVSSLRRSRPCPRGNYGIRRVKMRMEHYIFGKIIHGSNRVYAGSFFEIHLLAEAAFCDSMSF